MQLTVFYCQYQVLTRYRHRQKELDGVFTKETLLHSVLEQVPNNMKSKVMIYRAMQQFWNILKDEYGQAENFPSSS